MHSLFNKFGSDHLVVMIHFQPLIKCKLLHPITGLILIQYDMT